MRKTFPKSVVNAFLLLMCSISYVAAQNYGAILSGPNEAPPNASPAKGFAIVAINGNSMRIYCNFNGLLSGITVAHIHAATAVALSGTVGVATMTPTFTSFPSGVTGGSYERTFDMSLTSSFNPSYLTNQGGTAALAWDALKTAILAGKSYFNIHTSAFPGGEIRGFLIPGCVSTKTGNWNDSTVWSCGHVPNGSSFVTISPAHIVTIADNVVAYAKNVEINGELKKGTNSNLILNQ